MCGILYRGSAVLRQLLTLVTALALVSGCSLIQTHINVPTRPTTDSGPWAGDLESAIEQAEQLRQRYHSAVIAQTEARNGVALTLIPLSAAALALGISNAPSSTTRNFLIGAGVGGAALFGLGSYIIDQGRQRIYVIGEKAVTCAILATRPLLMRKEDFAVRKQQVEQLAIAVSEAEAANVDPVLVSQGRSVLASARALLQKVDTAALTLSQQLEVINADISDQLIQNEPDLNRALAIASGLKTNAAVVVPGIPKGPALPTGQVHGAEIIRPLTLTPAENLRAKIATVAPWLTEAADLQAAIQQVAACTPASQNVPRLLVGSSTVDVSGGQTLEVAVATTRNDLRVYVTGLHGVSASAQGANGAEIVRVVVDKDAAPGDRLLTVSYPEGGDAQLVIRVAAAGQGITQPNAPPVARSKQRSAPTAAATLSSEEFADLRARMGMNEAQARTQDALAFVNGVKLAQKCLQERHIVPQARETGAFTSAERDVILRPDNACLPKSDAAPGGSVPPPPSPIR